MRTHKKSIDHARGKYLFSIGPSVFTTRKGLFDLCIAREGSWGAREDDGNLYTTIQRLAVESESVLRHYEHIPMEVAEAGLDFLRTFKHELNTANNI